MDNKPLLNVIKYSPKEIGEKILQNIDIYNPPLFTINYKNISNLIKDANTILDEKGINLAKFKILDLDMSGYKDENVALVGELIKNGFIPDLFGIKGQGYRNLLIDYYIKGYNKLFIDFWYDKFGIVNDFFSSLIRNNKKWVYATIEGWKNIAIKTNISFPLVLYDKSLLYSSMRPKTEMLIFKQPTSPLYTSTIKNNDYEYILDKNIKGIPVTRYAKGMSMGLFHDTKGDYCGTFYYYEPESTAFLTYNKSKIYRNKYEAMLDLDANKAKGIEGSDEWIEDPLVRKYYLDPKSFPDDLKLSPLEYFKLRNPKIDPVEKKGEVYWEKIGNDKKYIGYHLAYALEDGFDQMLCQTAKLQNIDIIILTHMIGSNQVVTEVLDTRDRTKSFSSLFYPNTR